MIGDIIKANILSIQQIPYLSPDLKRELKLPEEYTSIGIVTTDIDDVSYSALDEATKKAEVKVVYATSMYAGSGNASTALAGEFIGILASYCPEEVKSGLEAFCDYVENEAFFYSADENGEIPYFAHCISRTGSYLSEIAGIEEGNAIAYLIAPPNEAICGLDEALKTANVELKTFYGPPTETNFAGGLLTGSQSDCKSACEAFANKVKEIAANPQNI